MLAAKTEMLDKKNADTGVDLSVSESSEEEEKEKVSDVSLKNEELQNGSLLADEMQKSRELSLTEA